ncbi:ATP-dependent DNA helicase [bacterium]|nr:ATP-dependent DNA helicase [bacterium]
MSIDFKKFFIDKFQNYSKEHPDFSFETRNEQIVFGEEWYKQLSSNGYLFIEAPTGVGKTFGYLLPIFLKVLEAKERGEKFKALVATSTIHLQEQIFYKDIPILSEILGDINVQILKGRSNYLCLMRAHKFLNEPSTPYHLPLFQWIASSENGEYQEMEHEIPQSVWKMLHANLHSCRGKQCPHYSKCYFFKTRVSAERADLLVMNHHLFLTDAYKREIPFLKNMNGIVFDEAHHLLKSLESVTTLSVSDNELNYNLLKLEDFLSNGTIYSLFKRVSFIDEAKNISEQISLFREKIDEFSIEISSYLNSYKNINLNHPDFEKNSPFLNLLKTFRTSFEIFYSDFRLFFSSIERDSGQFSEPQKALYEAINLSLIESESFFIDFYKLFVTHFDLKKDDINVVKWLTFNEVKAGFNFNSLDLSEIPKLAKTFLDEDKNYLFTSATLSISNSFDYMKKGLNISKASEMILKSPFDLKKQVSFFAGVVEYGYQNTKYYDDMASELIKILKKGQGMVLFASYSDMNQIVKRFKSGFKSKSIELFVQGENYSRTMLIEEFKKSSNGIIFGTKSFWEGVDIKGEKLSRVVIVKLPFSSKEDPIMFNKERLSNNKSLFFKWMLDEMILSLKQGIGRLIRSKDDSGEIYILDSRFKHTHYSSKILENFKEYNIQDYGVIQKRVK